MYNYLTAFFNCFLKMDVPGPPTHQEIISKPIHFNEAFKSFNVGATRFPAINKVTCTTKIWICGDLTSERTIVGL